EAVGDEDLNDVKRNDTSTSSDGAGETQQQAGHGGGAGSSGTGQRRTRRGSVAGQMGPAADDRLRMQGCIGRGTGEADVAGGVPWQPRKADVGAGGHAGVGWSGRGGRGGGGGGGGEGPGGSRLMRTRHAREVIEGQPLPTITRPAA